MLWSELGFRTINQVAVEDGWGRRASHQETIRIWEDVTIWGGSQGTEVEGGGVVGLGEGRVKWASEAPLGGQ